MPSQAGACFWESGEPRPQNQIPESPQEVRYPVPAALDDRRRSPLAEAAFRRRRRLQGLPAQPVRRRRNERPHRPAAVSVRQDVGISHARVTRHGTPVPRPQLSA